MKGRNSFLPEKRRPHANQSRKKLRKMHWGKLLVSMALLIRYARTTTEYGCCPGWEQTFVPVFQPGLPFRDKRLRALVPGGTTGKKEDFISRSRFPTGTKEIEKIKKKDVPARLAGGAPP